MPGRGGPALLDIKLKREGEDERVWEMQADLGAEEGRLMESSSQVPLD